MTNYNRTRRDQEILERAKNSPSFTVHLHPEHWTLNNGGKFLYNNQIASLLDDIRAYRIPVDFLELFEAAKVPFYDGCMVVELWDHRPQRPKEPAPGEPEKTQVVLHPNSETLWADLCSLNQRLGSKWTDQDALEIEARILLATSSPLCLDPDPHLTRIVNHVLKFTTPTVPVSLKRKAAALEPEEDETDKARRTKIMQYMAPPARSHAPNYKVLDNLHKYRQAKAAKPPTPAPTPVQTTAPPVAPTLAPPIAQYAPQAPQARQPSATPSTPNPNVSQTHSPAESEDAKKRAKLKVPMTYPKSQTPVPQPATHQFVHQHSPNRAANPSPSPSSASPLQPQVYANVHASEAAKRASTPAQVYASPRPPTAIPPVQQPAHLQGQPQQRPPSVAPYQPTVPNPHFAPQPTRTTSQKSPAAVTAQPVQAPPQPHPTMQAMYAQQYSQHAQQQQLHLLQQQRLAAQQKNGRLTPQAVPVKAASPAARASPIVTNQPLASRSPMPQAQSVQPMTSHPPPHPQQIPYHYTPAHMRSLVQGGLTHQHLLQAQLAANGRPTPSPHPPAQSDAQPQQGVHQPHQPHQPHHPQQAQPQQQPQSVQQAAAQQVPHPYPPQVYSYAQMGFPQGRIHPSYWSVNMAGRVPNLPMTAQPIPGMPGTAQQLNAKAVPNGNMSR